MSFSTENVARFLRSFYDEPRDKLEVDFVNGVHSVISEHDTFKFQDRLPQLPVPPLADTIKRYLRSLRAIQTDPEAYARSEQAAKAFLDSECAQTLQQALEDRARTCEVEKRGFPHTHWLEEWWENLAYLSGRDPLAINLNCFGTLFHGISIDYGPSTDRNLLALTRAAAVIYGTMQFRNALLTSTLGPEALDRRGRMPLCMAQFNRVFSSIRAPGAEMDKITQFDIDSDPSILPHVAVWCMGRWYSMSVVRGDQRGAGEGGSSSALAVFTAYLRSLIALQQDAQRRNERESEDSEPAVAVLTSGERSFWSRARDEIATSNGVAAATLRQVESAAFHVVLSPECPRTPRERMNLCCHGGGGCGIDLWMDKSLTYLVFANGEVGFNMEHTHADAPIHARIVEHMRVAIVQDLSRAPAAQVSSSSDSDSVGGGDAWSSALRGADALALPAARHLSWNLRPGTASRASVDALITEGTAAARANIGAHRLDLVHAPHVSSGRIKASKMSPDSFVQVALQLAFHRDQGRSCSTYETGTTRAFLHGRTATIRSCTADSVALAEAIASGRASPAELVKKLQAALAAHGTVLRESVQAKGVDRHLLGLQLVARGRLQAGLDDMSALAPALSLFEDEGFKNSSTWELSTSNMTWTRTYDWPGFGAPTKAGYGVCYNITDSAVLMTVSANASSGKDPTRFARHIMWAMDTMLQLAEGAVAVATTTAKQAAGANYSGEQYAKL